MDNNFDYKKRHNYLRSLTKELAMAAFHNGDITPAEYLNLQVPQLDAKTMDKALCAFRPKGTTPLDAIIKHNDNRESIELKTKNMSEEQAKYIPEGDKEWFKRMREEAISDYKKSEVKWFLESSPTTVNWKFDEQEKEAIAKMYQEEHDLLVQALKKHGIEFDINQEKRRRFKTLKVEIQNLPHGGRVKRFYYNDGSIDGLLLLEYDVQNGYKFKLSSLIGKLSKEGADEMREQIGDLRKEWDREFDVTSLKGKMNPMEVDDIDKQIDDLRKEWEE